MFPGLKIVRFFVLLLFQFAVFDNVEDYCPGFKASVVGSDILPPPDLERIFGLTGGVSKVNWRHPESMRL